jgi:adenine deaminase
LVVNHLEGELYCNNNELEELIIPKGVVSVICHKNKIVNLQLSEGVKSVNCYGNQLTSLTIPSSVRALTCDLINGIEGQYKKGMRMKFIQKR